MTKKIAEEFIAALTQLESTRDVEPIVKLFAGDCEVGNAMMSDPLHGAEGALEFWRTYRDSFGGLRSAFRNKIYCGNGAALECCSEGTSRNGNSLMYEGVSILEIEGEKIIRIHAYFDPAKVQRQIAAC